MSNETELLQNSLNTLVRLGKEMRAKQNEYFMASSAIRPAILKYAKIAEQKFDDYLRLLNKRGFGIDTDNSKQDKLF